MSRCRKIHHQMCFDSAACVCAGLHLASSSQIRLVLHLSLRALVHLHLSAEQNGFIVLLLLWGRHNEEWGGHLRDEARPLTLVGRLHYARLTVGSRLWYKLLLCLTALCIQLHHHRPNIFCLCAHSICLYVSNQHGHTQYASQLSIKSWTCLSHRLWRLAHPAGEFGCLLNLLNLQTNGF